MSDFDADMTLQVACPIGCPCTGHEAEDKDLGDDSYFPSAGRQDKGKGKATVASEGEPSVTALHTEAAGPPPPSDRRMRLANFKKNHVHKLYEDAHGKSPRMFATQNIGNNETILREEPWLMLYQIFCKVDMEADDWANDPAGTVSDKCRVVSMRPRSATGPTCGESSYKDQNDTEAAMSLQEARDIQKAIRLSLSNNSPDAPGPSSSFPGQDHGDRDIKKATKLSDIQISISEVDKATSTKIDEQHLPCEEIDEIAKCDGSVETAGFERDENVAIDVSDRNFKVGEASQSSGQEGTFYMDADDAEIQMGKKLLADYKWLIETNPSKANAFKRLYPNERNEYGGDWLLRLFVRYSLECDVPENLNLDLLEPTTSDTIGLIPDSCGAMFVELGSVNHSCFPNTTMHLRYEAEGMISVELRATEDILLGDELTFKYEEVDRLRRQGKAIADFENMSGVKCDCEPCSRGYESALAWRERD